MKLAYSDLRRYDADPRSYDVPVQTLLSKEYARKRAALIDPQQGQLRRSPPGNVKAGDTTYLTVVDSEGNIASWIQSISLAFGSGVTVEGMGFMLHNRGCGLYARPRHPERARRRQAAVPHHHPGVHGARRFATSDSASWAAPISRSRTRSLSPTSWITG